MSRQEIWDLHLKAALILIRQIQISALTQKIDPKALRVAIYYMKFVDDYHAKERISQTEDEKLKKMAWDLFQEIKQKGII